MTLTWVGLSAATGAAAFFGALGRVLSLAIEVNSCGASGENCTQDSFCG